MFHGCETTFLRIIYILPYIVYFSTPVMATVGAGKRLKITSLSEGNRAIRKLGLGHVKEHIDEVQGKIIIQDYDLLTKPMPLLNIRGKIDWFDVKVLDHKTLAPLISIEIFE